MWRRVPETIFLLMVIGLLAIGCARREPAPEEKQIKPAEVSGTYRGVMTMEVDGTQVAHKAEMEINAEGYVERLYWQLIRNRSRTDEISWIYPNSCKFFRTHYRSERQFQQTKWGDVSFRRKQGHLEVIAHLPYAKEITDMNFQYDYPEGAINAYDAGGLLHWNPNKQCLTTNVHAVIPPIPVTVKPRGSIAVIFGKSRIHKVIPGARKQNTRRRASGPTITAKKKFDFIHVKLTHAPGLWFINAFNVDARIDRPMLIEYPETSYAIELADTLQWNAVVDIFADGRRIVKVPHRNLQWEMKQVN